MTFLRSFLAAVLLAACCCPPRVADRADDPALLADVQAIVAGLGPGARAAVWFGRAGERPRLAWNVETPMPTASAIKAAYLVELFDARDGALDAPLPGADAVLADAAHPAVAHFSAAQRAAAQTDLGGASTRRIGEAMIRGNGVSNATYNIAANLATAFAGGPNGLDAALHDRGGSWCDLRVRRYMLADRTANGDNEATAHAMAAVFGDLAQGTVPGLSANAHDACRAILARGPDAAGRQRFRKDGALDSLPITRVEAGWLEVPAGAFVHVVMLAQDGIAAADRTAAGGRLQTAAEAIEQRLIASLP